MFRYINDNIIRLEPTSFMGDFENGLRKSIKRVFPQSIIRGCWFHFCQAVRRNVSVKYHPLAEFIRTNKSASKAFHKILCLPLLPADDIPFIYNVIKSEVIEFDTKSKFKAFLEYFENFWINQVKLFLNFSNTLSANNLFLKIIDETRNFFCV